ncbi:MAG: hypothetical protein K0B01_03130 [Syntrophobacterales bacterium]|nr:hypothetical protein [Syntrophobacterales bacterium]
MSAEMQLQGCDPGPSEFAHGWQKEFIQIYGSRKERSSFPWLSTLAMLYPIGAQVTIANQGAPLLPTLGYGFANLGYLHWVLGYWRAVFGLLDSDIEFRHSLLQWRFGLSARC